MNLIEVLNRRASVMVMGLFKPENLQGKRERIVSLADQAIELYTVYGLVGLRGLSLMVYMSGFRGMILYAIEEIHVLAIIMYNPLINMTASEDAYRWT